MNNIAYIVLGAIRAQVCGQPYAIEGNLSEETLKEVFSISKAQDMSHLVAGELISQKKVTNPAYHDLFRRSQIMAVYRYELINHELLETCRVLEEAGIPYMPLKGSVMRQYYPEPWMRTSSDIDILVPKENVDAAAELLVNKLNYENRGIDEHDVQMFAPNGVHLELHFDTIEDYQLKKANRVLKNLWDEDAYCVKGHHYAMSNELFYFYHIAHMAKHFKYGGCGIRFFLDMWILNHKVKYDQNKKNDLLKAGELLEFAEHAERLSEVWFGEASHTEVTQRMEDYILHGGIYGSLENRVVVKSVRTGGWVRSVLPWIFRPFAELKLQYPILEKHKWLYPFCQVYRWFYLLFNKGLFRAKRVLNDGAKAYKENGDSVDQMMKDLKLNIKNTQYDE